MTKLKIIIIDHRIKLLNFIINSAFNNFDNSKHIYLIIEIDFMYIIYMLLILISKLLIH